MFYVFSLPLPSFSDFLCQPTSVAPEHTSLSTTLNFTLFAPSSRKLNTALFWLPQNTRWTCTRYSWEWQLFFLTFSQVNQVFFRQTEHGVNISTSRVKVTASRRHHGQRLTCTSLNPLFPAYPLTDSILLNVTCEYIVSVSACLFVSPKPFSAAYPYTDSILLNVTCEYTDIPSLQRILS